MKDDVERLELDEDEVRRVAYKIAQERLRARPGPLGGVHAPLPHRVDIAAAMDEARLVLRAASLTGEDG